MSLIVLFPSAGSGPQEFTQTLAVQPTTSVQLNRLASFKLRLVVQSTARVGVRRLVGLHFGAQVATSVSLQRLIGLTLQATAQASIRLIEGLVVMRTLRMQPTLSVWVNAAQAAVASALSVARQWTARLVRIRPFGDDT